MTDFTDDELVSAVLDGEATDAEAARVHADAGLSARLAELRAARDAIAAPVTLPTGDATRCRDRGSRDRLQPRRGLLNPWSTCAIVAAGVRCGSPRSLPRSSSPLASSARSRRCRAATATRPAARRPVRRRRPPPLLLPLRPPRRRRQHPPRSTRTALLLPRMASSSVRSRHRKSWSTQ